MNQKLVVASELSVVVDLLRLQIVSVERGNGGRKNRSEENFGLVVIMRAAPK